MTVGQAPANLSLQRRCMANHLSLAGSHARNWHINESRAVSRSSGQLSPNPALRTCRDVDGGSSFGDGRGESGLCDARVRLPYRRVCAICAVIGPCRTQRSVRASLDRHHRSHASGRGPMRASGGAAALMYGRSLLFPSTRASRFERLGPAGSASHLIVGSPSQEAPTVLQKSPPRRVFKPACIGIRCRHPPYRRGEDTRSSIGLSGHRGMCPIVLFHSSVVSMTGQAQSVTTLSNAGTGHASSPRPARPEG